MEFNLLEIIALLGGWSVISVAIIKWITDLITNKINVSWDKKVKEDLMFLKDELSQNRLLIENSISNYSSTQQITHNKKLDAVEVLWENVLYIRDTCGSAITFYKLLEPAEYKSLYEGDKIKQWFGDISRKDISIMLTKTDNVEKYRLYFGEPLWMLFFVYRAFIGRITVLLIEGIEKSDIIDWTKDKSTISLLENILSNEEMENLNNILPIAMHNLLAILENKIIHEINKVVSGQKASEETFENAKKISHLMQEYNSMKDDLKST